MTAFTAAKPTSPTASAPAARPSGAPDARRSSWRKTAGTSVFHASSGLISLLWFLPIVIVIVTAFRTQDDVNANGIASMPETFTLGNFGAAWTSGGMFQGLVNSLVITIPSVILGIFLSAAAAYGLSRFRIPFRRTILLTMLAGNLLPSQIALIPIAKLSEQLGMFDTLTAVIFVQVVFGLGFFTFVLYGFMRSIPNELQEAATIDGAGVFRIGWQIILPMTRPALAALSALSFTWVFNDLLWSITLLQSSSKLPITAAVLSLQGQFVSSWSVVAAGTVIAAIPCVVVFLFFQKSFIGGLALGAVK